MRLMFVLFLLPLTHFSIGKNSNYRFIGNWHTSWSYGLTYIKIKSSKKVIYYNSSCTNTASELTGTYSISADTILIELTNKIIELMFYENRLYSKNMAIPITHKEYGFKKTMRMTISGAKQKSIHLSNRKMRKRFHQN